MFIAIDDTYGPSNKTNSKYVTCNRRTHVGIAFPDENLEYIREQIRNCLVWIEEEFTIKVAEFHFVEIYNRKAPWSNLPEKANLAIFAAFAHIYEQYKWKVFIQTIDDRTLNDHGIKIFSGVIDQFNLENPSDLSLFWLLIKIKKFYSKKPEALCIAIDEGLGKPNTIVGDEIFHDYTAPYSGTFQSSSVEPLIQLADFMAYIINRSTHLYMKEKRSNIDNWFLDLINNMKINSTDLYAYNMLGDYKNLTIKDFDLAHKKDRKNKGL